MKKIILSFIIFLNAAIGFACRCGFNSISEEITGSDLVFTGKVLHKKIYGYQVYYTFLVIDIYKGNRTDSVRIETGMGGPDCGMEFELGRSYLVYSNKGRTSRCKRNSLVEESTDIVKLRYLFDTTYSGAFGRTEAGPLNEEETGYLNSNFRHRRVNGFGFENKRVAFFDNQTPISKKTYFDQWGGKDSRDDLIILTLREKGSVPGYDAIIVLNEKKKFRDSFRKKIIKLLAAKQKT